VSPPLAVGLALGGAATPAQWRRCLHLAERADAMGLHSLWLPEGHFRPGATASPLLGLAAFAARTRQIRIATTSLLLPIHHPLRAAADAAAVDRLSRGRLILGLGRGFQSPVFAGFGVERSTKRDRFDEALDAILAAWSGDPVALEGEHFAALDGGTVRLAVRPVQRPHPPLVVAAFGPKGLRQAAKRGLPYLASPLEPLSILEENYARWNDDRVGEPPAGAPRVPVMRTVYVGADPTDAARVHAALEAEARAVPRGAPKALARAATGEVSDRALIGTAREVAEQAARYRERLGMDLLVVRTEVPGVSPAERERSLERLVRDVLPLVA
jgi:alkanesulfonate monooxygenase SsuD/methylene tetrahydromethanopterin reductase-like flavin-dependent oxidoreductase (luciferase family)